VFTITSLPRGVHQVAVWHKSAGFFHKKVDVPETGTVEISLIIPLPSTE
jgi:hypothetical protein